MLDERLRTREKLLLDAHTGPRSTSIQRSAPHSARNGYLSVRCRCPTCQRECRPLARFPRMHRSLALWSQLPCRAATSLARRTRGIVSGVGEAPDVFRMSERGMSEVLCSLRPDARLAQPRSLELLALAHFLSGRYSVQCREQIVPPDRLGSVPANLDELLSTIP
jgi:hypothetical protein